MSAAGIRSKASPGSTAQHSSNLRSDLQQHLNAIETTALLRFSFTITASLPFPRPSLSCTAYVKGPSHCSHALRHPPRTPNIRVPIEPANPRRVETRPRNQGQQLPPPPPPPRPFDLHTTATHATETRSLDRPHVTMKATPLIINWHDQNQPIYSAHFEPSGKGRLATAGGDTNVRVRRVQPPPRSRHLIFLPDFSLALH